MPSRLPRALVLALATLLVLPAPAEAAPTKVQRTSAAQSRARPAARPRNAPARRPAPAQPDTKQDKAARLNRIYDEYWEAAMRLNPLQATFQGDPRFNDQLPNFLSAAARQQAHDFMIQWRDKVQAVGSDGLQGQDLLSYEIFLHDAQRSLAAEQFPSWMLPVNPYNNLSSLIAVLGSGTGAQPFRTVKDYENWSKRSLGVPVLFDQAIANMREGMKAGVVQPRALMEKVLPQLDAVIKPTAEESIFWAPVRNMPEDFSAEDRARLSAEYKRMIEYRLMPAYRALRGFIATEYLPATRTTDGLAALPGGQDWYAHNIASNTTLEGSPAAIHALGEQEVARLKQRIDTLKKTAKIRGSMQKTFSTMRNDRQFVFKDADALLAHYADVGRRADAALPALFSTRPKAALEIRPVEPARALTASSSSYQPGSADGQQPGVLYVNTGDLPSRKRWAVTMQYLHEGMPGHHFQLGAQQELATLPRFRRLGGDVAFVEGWGLYAESLGEELGLYGDPYDHLGYLQGSLLRTVRLVADTGLHAAGWSRQQAIGYMVENADLDTADATAEVERFMALPGQALAPRIGEIRIRRLRELAQTGLGERFDPRQFHHELLKDGSMPLDILQVKIERWIASQKP